MAIFSSGVDHLSYWWYVAAILIPTLYYLLADWFKVVRLAWRMPGPAALPVIGNSLLITESKTLQNMGYTCYKDYGPVFRLWGAFFPFIVVNDPQYVQAILSSHRNTDKITFYKFMHNFLGQGLITSSGDQWQTHRKWIQPCFHMKVMETFVTTFADSSDILIKKLKAKKSLKDMNIVSFVNASVLDILNEAVMGVSVLRERDLYDASSPFRQGKVVAQTRISRPWLMSKWIYEKTELAQKEMSQKDKLFDFTREIVRARRAKRMQKEVITDSLGTTKEKSSFLDFMIDIADKQEAFTEEDIIHELCTFMLAGQDSVGAALAFCLHYLSKNLECQERVIEELDAIFLDSARQPSIQDLREMRYLEQCIKETLRLNPSVPIIGRKIQETLVMGEYTLPAGTDVIVSPFALHHLPHVYPDPLKFDPDRFLPDNVEARHPYAYIPFSAGPRNCIGYKFSLLEMKTVLSTILRHYRLSTVAGKEELNLSYRITIRASGGIWMTLTPRETKCM